MMQQITTTETLLQRLQALLADIPATMTLEQYEQVGWAVRPLKTMIDQCRVEQASIQWARQHSVSFARVLPKAARQP